MFCYFRMSKNNNVSWGGLVSPGNLPPPMLIDSFSGHGLVYRIGYESKRTLKYLVADDDKETFIDVFCSVQKSNLGKPLFTCSYKMTSNESKQSFSGINPSRVTNKVLQLFGQKKKKWSGNEFFGFRREDVQRIINDYDSKTSQENNGNESNQEILFSVNNNPVPNVGCNNCTISWVGIQSIGTPNTLENYLMKVGNKYLRMQPGYTAVREVTTSEGLKVKVYCRVVECAYGPEFECFTEGENIKFSSTKPTKAMKEMFGHLNVKTLRHWSGFEFFGFNNTTVINQIMHIDKTVINEDSAENDMNRSDKRVRVDANKYPQLTKIASIQARNAGKTSFLQNKKSQTARNNAIHEAVALGSQDDVKSEFNTLLGETFVGKTTCKVLSNLFN